MPSTSNYSLNSYGFGSGGSAGTGTSNYSLEGLTGEASGQTTSTTNYSTLPGFVESEQANVPYVTLSNPSNYYDKLKFVINNTSPNNPNNPSDALYALEISTSSTFASGNSFVQTDDTLTATLVTADYQTYTAWGGATGANIIGLASNTTYYLRAKVTQGKFTESPYGPSSNAATIGQTISFCLYSNANCGAGGTTEAFGGLTPSSVTNSPTNIGIDFATNADAGGKIYVYALNGGLTSARASFTLTSATADLSAVASGFGAQVASVGQTSGGPLAAVSPYNGSSNNVGAIGTTASYLLNSLSPIVGGTSAVQLKVKTSGTTPSANDYSETLTFIAAASF